ncbi:MAG: hypothetical protein MSC31_16810 [Solirubrobacteraceae bacterium MAG38_C4-C5]|nr:hypothetical protein [Candidatus Siliceabacter maunaloa]
MGVHPERRAGAVGAVLAALLLAACGSPSEEEVTTGREDFVRAADAVCESAREQVEAAPRPASLADLGATAQQGADIVRGTITRLDGLRESSAESLPPQAGAFFTALPEVLAAAEATADAAGDVDAGGSRSAARELQEAGGRAFEAAQAAGLDACGRGGNQAADAVLLAVYRDEFLLVTRDVGSQLLQLEETPGTLEEAQKTSDESLRLLRQYQRRFGRLGPPSGLEERHARSLSRNAELIAVLQDLAEAFDAPAGSVTEGEIERLLARLRSRADRVEEAENRLRGELDLPQVGEGPAPSPDRGPSPPPGPSPAPVGPPPDEA